MLLAASLAAQLLSTEPLRATPHGPRASRLENVARTDDTARWEPVVLHTTALLTSIRYAEAFIYPHPFAEGDLGRIFEHYRDAYTNWPLFDPDKRFFEWDGDSWHINALGHGLLGSELYVRARICHFGWAGSLAYAIGSSVAWEYVFEANGVRPSALDLVYTPLSGMLLGEARYFIYRTAQSMTSPTARGILSAIVDPLGELERHLLASPC